MSDLVSRSEEALGRRGPGSGVSRRGHQRVQREVEDALVTATRMEGTAYLTGLALNHLGILAVMEARVIASTPAADPLQMDQTARRASALVESFVMTAAGEIARRAL